MNLKEMAEDAIAETGKKAIKKGVGKVIDAIMIANRIPTLLGYPYKIYYGKLADEVIDVIRSEKKYQVLNHYRNTSQINNKVQLFITEVRKWLREIKSPKDWGIEILFIGLTNPKLGKEAMDQQTKEAAKVVEFFDYVISTIEDMVKRIAQEIDDLDKDSNNLPRFRFDFVFKHGALGSIRNDLCNAGNNLLDLYIDNINQRNEWLIKLGLRPEKPKTLAEIETRCERYQ